MQDVCLSKTIYPFVFFGACSVAALSTSMYMHTIHIRNTKAIQVAFLLLY